MLKAEVAVLAGAVDSLEADGNLGIAHAELNDAMGIQLDHPTSIKPVEVTREAPPDPGDCLDEALVGRPGALTAEGKHGDREIQCETRANREMAETCDNRQLRRLRGQVPV